MRTVRFRLKQVPKAPMDESRYLPHLKSTHARLCTHAVWLG